jgi:hypothetical protein
MCKAAQVSTAVAHALQASLHNIPGRSFVQDAILVSFLPPLVPRHANRVRWAKRKADRVNRAVCLVRLASSQTMQVQRAASFAMLDCTGKMKSPQHV